MKILRQKSLSTVTILLSTLPSFPPFYQTSFIPRLHFDYSSIIINSIYPNSLGVTSATAGVQTRPSSIPLKILYPNPAVPSPSLARYQVRQPRYPELDQGWIIWHCGGGGWIVCHSMACVWGWGFNISLADIYLQVLFGYNEIIFIIRSKKRPVQYRYLSRIYRDI